MYCTHINPVDRIGVSNLVRDVLVYMMTDLKVNMIGEGPIKGVV